MTTQTLSATPVTDPLTVPGAPTDTAQAIDHLKHGLTPEVIDKRVDDLIHSQVFLVDGAVGRFVTRKEFVEMNGKNQYTTFEVDGQQCAGPTEDIKKRVEGVKADTQNLMPDALTIVRRYFHNVVVYKYMDDKSYQLGLIGRWEQGKFIDDLINAASKYGSRTVTAYADDIGVSAEAVYQYHRFFTSYTHPRVVDLMGKKIPWRTVVVLLSLEDDKKRQALESKYSTLKHDGIAEAVKEANKSSKAAAEKSGKKADKRGGAAVGTVFRSTNTLLTDTSAKVAEFDDAFSSFLKIPVEKRTKETITQLKMSVVQLRELQKKVEKVLAHIDKVKEAAKKANQ